MTAQTEKHTPGPWRMKGGPVAFDIIGEAKTIAEVPRWGLSGTELDRMSWANARLIAAAPQLLEALQALTRAIERHNKAVGCEGFVERAIEQARAAIRLAESGE